MVPKDATKQMKWLQPMLYKCKYAYTHCVKPNKCKTKSITLIHPHVNIIDRVNVSVYITYP